MDKAFVTNEVGRKERCGLCGWHGRVLAVRDETFVNWTCPQCQASHSGLLPRKTRFAKQMKPTSAAERGS